MNGDQYHLGKIAEEAVEVAQRALKAQQFGLGEVHPGQDLDNLDRLLGEFHDLFTTFENFVLLCGSESRENDPIPSSGAKSARLQKMRLFLDLSKSLGQVDENAFI